jgi:hypothetical protein
MPATDIAEKAAEADAPVPFKAEVAKRNSLMPEGHGRQRMTHKVAPGVTQDDVRHPDYWRNIAPLLSRHDLITIYADDESWEIEACVERVLQGGAHISVRKVYKRETLVHAGRIVDGLGDFYSEWRVGLGWCIVRRRDGHPVVQGHTLEANAIADWQRQQPRKVTR